MGQLCNISCTLLVSKVYESFLLKWAMEEVKFRDNQYGGVKGCSTAQYLINLWQEILSNAEDNRAATILTAIDFAKAFNRVSHQACLNAFAKKGASTQGVFLFNVCSDELEDSGKTNVLEDTENDIAVGEFLDAVDREPLRREEELTEERTAENDTDSSVTSESEYLMAEEDFVTQATSTPISAGRLRRTCPAVSPFRLREDDSQKFVLLEKTKNKKRPKCIIYSSESESEYPLAEAAASRWQEKPVCVVKYVDDQMSAEKLDMSNSVNGRHIGVKRAVRSENQFKNIEYNANVIGMKVNSSKTQLLCVSAAKSYLPEPYIIDSDGARVECCESLK